MGDAAIEAMFPGVPPALFRPHDWRRDVVELGRVPESFVREASAGLCAFDWPAQVNRLVVNGGFDLVLSLGQVVPHEVVGMANYTKNLFVGVGGKDGIDRSHWIGAAYGIERTLGRVDTPVRAVLDYAQERFAAAIPVLYALTVVGPGDGGVVDADGNLATRGLFVGAGREAFVKAAALSAEVNILYLPKAASKVVVYLDPDTFKSTWLGNKAIYRTRLAIADAGELAGDLAGAAHLAHGSTEGRFSVTYAAGGLGRTDVEDVGYRWADCQEAMGRYGPDVLKDGWNAVGGEEVFFIRNPALGLWATRERFSAL